MFELGFLGTKAPLYMDIVTLYFALLPLLLALAIAQAVKGRIVWHLRMQLATLLTTLFFVLFFEVGVRFDGGFSRYAAHSSIPFDLLLSYLVVHIIIAVITISGWIYLVIASLKAYKQEGVQAPFFKMHKRMGKQIFFALLLTSAMGVGFYLMLFM